MTKVRHLVLKDGEGFPKGFNMDSIVFMKDYIGECTSFLSIWYVE